MMNRDNWLIEILYSGMRWLLDRYSMAGERARLRELGEAQLSDMGLTMRDARREASRPFWQGQRCL